MNPHNKPSIPTEPPQRALQKNVTATLCKLLSNRKSTGRCLVSSSRRLARSSRAIMRRETHGENALLNGSCSHMQRGNPCGREMGNLNQIWSKWPVFGFRHKINVRSRAVAGIVDSNSRIAEGIAVQTPVRWDGHTAPPPGRRDRDPAVAGARAPGFTRLVSRRLVSLLFFYTCI